MTVRKCVLRALAIRKNSDAQLGDQRRVPRQHAEVAFFAGHLHGVHRFLQDVPLRRHDLQFDDSGSIAIPIPYAA